MVLVIFLFLFSSSLPRSLFFVTLHVALVLLHLDCSCYSSSFMSLAIVIILFRFCLGSLFHLYAVLFLIIPFSFYVLRRGCSCSLSFLNTQTLTSTRTRTRTHTHTHQYHHPRPPTLVSPHSHSPKLLSAKTKVTEGQALVVTTSYTS